MPDTSAARAGGDGYSFTRQGRSAVTLTAAAGWIAALAALWLGLGAAGWLVALLALPVVPALLDLARNPAAGMVLTDRRIAWYSGALKDSVALARIAHVRLDTRWDFSVRVTLVLESGKRLRLPQEAMPPHKGLEAELTRRGLKTERHHFVIF